MAEQSVCAQLLTGQDSACTPLKRRYFQQAVVMNKSDIDATTVVIEKTDYDLPTPVCKYNVAFSLKEGKTGYKFIGPANGSNFSGAFNKATSDLGFPQYIHTANLLLVGATEAAKCILESLDKGSYVVAYQFTDGTVEIYGMEHGLSTGDYTYDVQAGGGGSAIILSSNELAPENYLPMIYKSGTPGGEEADFDSAFENPAL